MNSRHRPVRLSPILASAARETGSDYLAFLADSLRRLPQFRRKPMPKVWPNGIAIKHVIGDLMSKLFEQTPFIAEAVDQTLKEINSSPDKLDAVLEEQNYRLAYWETAKQELPYRRFFDVNTLVVCERKVRRCSPKHMP